MKGTLFENQIQEYGDIFQKDNVYQISNAPLEPVHPKYKDRDGDCSIRFGGQTMVQPIATEVTPNKVQYVPLASVSYESGPDDRYGLVLFISDIRTRITETGIEHSIRDISVIDHSTTVQMTISIWNDLTDIKDPKLLSWNTEPVIAAFLGLRVTTTRGFILSSSLSTTIDTNPTGEEFVAFHDWVMANFEELENKMTQLVDTKNPAAEKSILTIQQILDKKQEIHWVKVKIPEPDQARLISYEGCNKCGKRVDLPLNKSMTCPKCFKLDCTSVPRTTFKFDAVDETGELSLTTFAEDCEKLFKLPIIQIFEQTNIGTLDFGSISRDLSSNEFYVAVGPSYMLTKKQALSWVLKDVSWT
uniref:Replication factor A C-terminal domain-containing protein n=2 Tax=Chenopodium quinoa TaxID=63459 RepID=A0A803N334_CHEQI